MVFTESYLNFFDFFTKFLGIANQSVHSLDDITSQHNTNFAFLRLNNFKRVVIQTNNAIF